MAQFDTSKRKIQKIWEKVDKNEQDLKTIFKTVVDYNSISFNKSITQIPLITDKLFDSSTDYVKEILLINFPEYFINMLTPVAHWWIDDDLNTGVWHESLSTANSEGILNNGDLSFNNRFKWWFNRVDDKHFNLKIFYQMNIIKATVTGLGFGSYSIPSYFSIYLNIPNDQIYENTNQKKQ